MTKIIIRNESTYTPEEWQECLFKLGIKEFSELVGKEVYYSKKVYGVHNVIEWHGMEMEYKIELDGQGFWVSPFKLTRKWEKDDLQGRRVVIIGCPGEERHSQSLAHLAMAMVKEEFPIMVIPEDQVADLGLANYSDISIRSDIVPPRVLDLTVVLNKHQVKAIEEPNNRRTRRKKERNRIKKNNDSK